MFHQAIVLWIAHYSNRHDPSFYLVVFFLLLTKPFEPVRSATIFFIICTIESTSSSTSRAEPSAVITIVATDIAFWEHNIVAQRYVSQLHFRCTIPCNTDLLCFRKEFLNRSL